MCFGGGGGGGSAPAPQIFNAQPVSKQFEIPKPPELDRQYRPLTSEATTPSVRTAGGKRKQKAGLTPLRQKLATGMTTGVTVGAEGAATPPGGINL